MKSERIPKIDLRELERGLSGEISLLSVVRDQRQRRVGMDKRPVEYVAAEHLLRVASDADKRADEILWQYLQSEKQEESDEQR